MSSRAALFDIDVLQEAADRPGLERVGVGRKVVVVDEFAQVERPLEPVSFHAAAPLRGPVEQGGNFVGAGVQVVVARVCGGSSDVVGAVAESAADAGTDLSVVEKCSGGGASDGRRQGGEVDAGLGTEVW